MMIRMISKTLRKQLWKSIVFALILYVLCIVTVIVYPNHKRASYEDLSPYVKAAVEYADGRKAFSDGIEFGPVNRGDRVTLHITLPYEKKSDAAIMAFGVNHAVTRVLYRDTLLASYGDEIAERGDLICHRNYFIPVPEDAWGQTITVSLQATENKAFNRLAQLWLYPAEKAYHYFFDLEFGRMIVSLSVLIISVTTLLAMPFFFRQDKKRYRQLICVAVFGLISAMWMVLAEGLQQFFDVDSYLLTTFEFAALAAQVIPICGYILAGETEPGKKKILRRLFAFDTASVALICLLNYSNLAHFPVTLSASIGVIFVNGVFFVWNSLQNMNYGYLSKRTSMLGVLELSMNGVSDAVRFSLYRSSGKAVFSRTQKTFPLGVLLFFILILISSFLRDREQQEEERHTRARLLASQIQPHFLYNTLTSIRELIFENPQYAAETLRNFTVYLRGAVRAMSDVQVVPFEEELKNIRAYAEIEKMRMQDRLHISYQIEASGFFVPPFSIQPIVENAIRHGIYPRKSGGDVTVCSRSGKDSWIVEVTDTGVGFDVQGALKKAKAGESDSAGLINLMARLQEVAHASVTVQSVPGAGTTVTVTLPRKDNPERGIYGKE